MDKFNIYNKDNTVVATAASLPTAFNIVTYMNNNDRANAPFHCAPIQ